MAQSSGSSFFFDRVLPVAYSVGAAVVIVGALFKIQHWEGGSTMLTIGLGTEAVIFLFYALAEAVQKKSKDPDWERVYPELADDYTGPKVSRAAVSNAGAGLTAGLDNALANAKVTPDVFENLGKGFKSLTETVSNINTLTDATVATKQYTDNVKSASSALGNLNESYGGAINALSSLTDASKDAQEYRDRFKTVTKNLDALNAVYELELQDTQKHLKALNSFYANLATAIENTADASKESQVFKNELNRLTTNIASLNTVYGNMLTAMRGNA
ncbi:gliding motility protein GldL [Ravibacter arvi]|uniref:Gliding motility protein GldL n=1 Tax=Ravibacter arvi TaxID=2051041 RepID=A0ABP8LYH8_9BACT